MASSSSSAQAAGELFQNKTTWFLFVWKQIILSSMSLKRPGSFSGRWVAHDFGLFCSCSFLIPLVYWLQSHHRPAKSSCNESSQITKKWMGRNISNLDYLTPHNCPTLADFRTAAIAVWSLDEQRKSKPSNCLHLLNPWVCPTWRDVP